MIEDVYKRQHLKGVVGRVAAAGIYSSSRRAALKGSAAGLLTAAGHGAFNLDFGFAASAGAVVDAAFYCTFQIRHSLFLTFCRISYPARLFFPGWA